MVEIREAPVPVSAYQVYPDGGEYFVSLEFCTVDSLWNVMAPNLCGRSLKVGLSNGQTIIVRAKK